jgi:LuxR family maltose regulon positive regulatory protein
MPLVSRSHLVNRLQQGLTRPLTLLLVAAGYGKTTLLAQWLTECELPTVWLSLEAQDNDPVRFLTCLAAAAQAKVPDLDFNVLTALQAPYTALLERAKEQFLYFFHPFE